MALVTQETLFKLYSPETHDSVSMAAAAYANTPPPHAHGCLRANRPLRRHPASPSWEEGGKDQQQQLVQSADCCPLGLHGRDWCRSAQPLRGLPVVGQGAKQRGESSNSPERSLGPKGAQRLPAVDLMLSKCLPSLPLNPFQLLAHTASLGEVFPRSPPLLRSPSPGVCSEPGYGQLQFMASNSSLGRDSERLLHIHLLYGTHNSVDLYYTLPKEIFSKLKDSSPLDFHSFLSYRNYSLPLVILSALLWIFSSSGVSFLRWGMRVTLKSRYPRDSYSDMYIAYPCLFF